MTDRPDLAALHCDALTEAGVFHAYGRCMLRAQEMEEGIRVLHGLLVDDDELDGLDFEKAIKRFLNRPVGRLVDALGLDPRLADRLREGLRVRNALAHRFWVNALTDLSTGTNTPLDLVEPLRRYELSFWAVTQKVQRLADDATDELLDDETRDEIERMMLEPEDEDDDA